MPRLYFHEKLLLLSLTALVTLGGYWYLENRLGLDIEGYLARASSIIARNVTPAAPVGSLAEGLIGYWKLDEASWNGTTNEVVDSSEQDNHGTAVGAGGVPTTVSDGRLGRAGSFDGVDDYIDVANESNFDQTDYLSVSGWVKMNADVSRGGFAGKSPDGGSAGGGWYFDYGGFTAGQVEFGVISGSSKYIFAGTPMSLGEWHHVVGVFDKDLSGNARVALYIDGDMQSPTYTTLGVFTTILANNTQVVIGRPNLASSTLFPGSIDDVRIYNRALSASEITQLYQLGARTRISVTPPSVEAGLVGHWTFDGRDTDWGTNTTNDISGNANHGTITNMSTSTSPTPGRLGQGLKFDGVDDFVSSTATFFTGGNPVTYSFWAYVESASTTGGFLEDGLQAGASSDGLSIGVGASTQDNAGNDLIIGYSGLSWIDSNVQIGTGWRYITVVFPGDRKPIVYINGTHVYTFTGTPSYRESTGSFQMGGYHDGDTASRFLNTSLDDVRIYNSVLSAAEISQLYQQGATTHVAVTPPSVEDGLVGHWTFDGKDVNWATNTFTDRAGGNNGTTTTLATSSAPTAGRLGQGLEFDGVDDVISISDTTGSPLDLTTAFTLSAWINPNVARDQVMIAHKTSAYGINMGFSNAGVGGEAGKIGCHRFITSSWVVVNSTSNQAPNKWTNVSCTFDGSNFRIYVDGVLENTSTNSTVTATNNNALTVSAATAEFPGKVDDFRVYNRAFSASEISQLYELGR